MAVLAPLLLAGCKDSAERAGESAALANFHLQQGNIVEARRAISEALSERDDIVNIHLLRGRIEVTAGDRQAAYSAYYNALALDPVNMEALDAVSQLGIGTGNLRESLRATERLLTLSPNRPSAVLVRGLHELVRRRYEEAVGYADRAIELAPTDDNSFVLKARALFLDGKSDEALQVLDDATKNGERGGSLSLTKLEVYRELRDGEGMQREFTKLRELRPDDLGLRVDEANLLFKTGDSDRAAALVVSAASSVEEGSPEVALLSEQLVRLFEEFGHDVLDDDAWTAIAKNAPEDLTAGLIRYLLVVEDLELAERLIGLMPADRRNVLGALLSSQRGDAGHALKIATAILEEDETNCDALLAKSQAHLVKKDAEEAVRLGQQAVSECPDRVANYIASARAYTAWERTAGAERVFGQGIDTHPQRLSLFKAYTEWLQGEGRNRKAVATMRRFTRDTPASIVGWEYYGELCEQAARSCVEEAAKGAEEAATRFGIDMAPGQLQPNGLFGRFIRR